MAGRKQTIKLVALDLDGTLLDHRSRVAAGNSEAIERVQAQGVGVVLATGKTRESAVPILEELNLTLPGVFFQGHIISEAGGHVLREKVMEPQLVGDVLSYVEDRGLPVVVYDRHGLWTTAPGAHRDLIHEKYVEPLPRLVSSADDSMGINKILVATEGDQGTLRGELERRFGSRLRVLQAIPEYIELMRPDISKGEGVAWLLQYLGIDRQALLAVGDGENDIELLRLAGIGVAVDNAAAHVKDAAGFIVASNDQGGVAEALERFVLNR